MTIKVKVIAPFLIPGQAEDGSLELPDGVRVLDVFRRAHAPLVTNLFPVSVNGKQARRSQKLKEGDLLVVITPISGG